MVAFLYLKMQYSIYYFIILYLVIFTNHLHFLFGLSTSWEARSVRRNFSGEAWKVENCQRMVWSLLA